MRQDYQEGIGYAMIILASSFWGAAASLGKSLMQSGLSTVMLMQTRSVITTILLLAFILSFGRKHLLIALRDIPLFLLLGIPALALVNVSYYYAISLMPVAIAVFIQFTAPVLVFVYGLFSKTESVSRNKLFAILLCLSGMVLMLQIRTGDFQGIPPIAVLSAIVSMLTYAFYLILSHGLRRKYSALTLVLYGYGIAALFWCLLQNPAETTRILNSQQLWRQTIIFALLSTLIPFCIFLVAVRHVSPTGASIASTSETVTASLFAFLFLGERLEIPQIIGAALILSAVIILLYRHQAVPVLQDP